jgi:hypothetical protein
LNISRMTGSFTGTGFVRLGSAPGSQGGLVLTDAGALSINYTGTGAQLLVGDQGTGTVVTDRHQQRHDRQPARRSAGRVDRHLHDGRRDTDRVDDGSGVAGGMRIGLAGNGTFTQNNGAVSAAYVQIGGANFGQGGGGTGTYNLNGGHLKSPAATSTSTSTTASPPARSTWPVARLPRH